MSGFQAHASGAGVGAGIGIGAGADGHEQRLGHWGIQPLWDRLHGLLPGLSIEVMEQVDSTNQLLAARLHQAGRNAQGRGLRSEDLNPSLLVAVQQTAGRGRLGRSWMSRPGSSLTFSLSLVLQRPDWSGLSLAVGLAVARALDPAGTRIGLKWPNDLWLLDGPGQGRKLGGILIEGLSVAGQRAAVIGIGLNVLPLRLSEPVASLAELEPGTTAEQALSQLMPELAQTLVDFERQGFAPLAADFAARDLLRGQAVTTTDARCHHGWAEGVADDGALCVRGADGTVHRIVGGEVSVRPAPARPPAG